ncbi:rolling circle replication-associated protein [Vibrio quintilis]|uniref:Replication-associated protein ORF2/G2P domain-containing protein n=1 Tax=Vibrio quintilis TaxID=1117707 RepID=A0A1M7YRF0_9VIBR|nr:hypothetical protein [Vibrio quintilis]SHO55116.1 hypothetical protein VQ7734_00835 [Vibrio quintilis]
MLSDKDVVYIAGAAQNSEKTRQNIAAVEGGFFSGFIHPRDDQWMHDELAKVRHHEQLHHLRTRKSSETGRAAQREALKDIGLSKGAKVRQEGLRSKLSRIQQRVSTLNHALKPLSVLSSSESYFSHEGLYESYEQSNDDGKSRFYLMSREWSGQYKGQLIYKPRPCDAPDANDGERYTEKLTSRAVRKIFESGAYVAAVHGGFTTFLTLTFDAEQRARIFSGEITLGSEVSRFLDGLKKMYQRGFHAEVKGKQDNALQHNISQCSESRFVEGSEEDFHYMWVAECPANEDGEANPHVHLLMRWGVERDVFDSWAKRIEKIWGHGMANLQRIKYPKAAGSYIIKAVGYAAKGNNAEQGLIRGNRYNIARCSRAPAWEVLASFDAANMAGIIKECGYKLEQWRAPIERDIRRKQTKKKEAIKAAGIAKSEGNSRQIVRLQRLIQSLETESRELKTQMKSRGVFARSDNNFSITFEGENAKDQINDFLIWAAGARDWTMNTPDADLTDIKRSAIERYEPQYQRYLEKRADWKSLLEQAYPPTPDDDEINHALSTFERQFRQYQSIT